MIIKILTTLKTNKKKYFHRTIWAIWITASLIPAGILLTAQFKWGNAFRIPSEIAIKTNYYHYTWIKFNSMTGKQLHAQWNDMFWGKVYEWDGNPKYDKYDCISAFCYSAWKMGSNFPFIPVDKVYVWLQQVSTPRTNFYSIRSKDIIIFKYIINKKIQWHIGWIEFKTTEGYIRYMDMNAKTNADYKYIAYGDPTIMGIFPMTFPAWTGDLLNGVKEI